MMLQSLKRSGLWSLAIALLMAAQLALTLHTVDHQLGIDSRGNEHCTLCHMATAMDSAPPTEFLGPALYVLSAVFNYTPEQSAPAITLAGFRARAPPLNVSV